MENEKTLKGIVIGLVAVAVLMAAALTWVWLDRNKVVGSLTTDKETLTVELTQLQADYQNLSTNNDSLNTQLDKERLKVEELIVRVKKTDATNRSKIKQYEKELGTLRSIMRSYIIQIDSLNTLNISLRKDVAEARDEANTNKQKYDEMKTTADEFAKKVETGSVLKARGLNGVAITPNNKETDRSSRTEKLKVCASLIENTLAERGPLGIYIRVKGPDGFLLTTSQQQYFTMNGEKMLYSASREVDYQGSEIEVCIYFSNGYPFTKGVYSIDLFTSKGKLGTTEILLK